MLLVVLLIGLNLETLLGTLGSFATATYTVYLLAIMTAAYLLGAADAPTRTVFALGTGCRNLPAALVIARANSDDPAVTVMLIVAFVVTLVVLLALALAMRRRMKVTLRAVSTGVPSRTVELVRHPKREDGLPSTRSPHRKV